MERCVAVGILRVKVPAGRAGNQVCESFHGIALRSMMDWRLAVHVLEILG